jgi:hypothetical protein
VPKCFAHSLHTQSPLCAPFKNCTNTSHQNHLNRLSLAQSGDVMHFCDGTACASTLTNECGLLKAYMTIEIVIKVKLVSV